MRKDAAGKLRLALKWAPIGVVVAQIVLLISGVLTVRQAAIVFLSLEILLAIVLAGQFLSLARRYGGLRRQGAIPSEAFAEALEAAVPKPVAVLIRYELGIIAAIAAAIARRRSMLPGERVLTYGGHVRMLLIFMVGISVVELGVVEYFVPWVWLRWTLIILGAYGLLWVIGFACAVYVRPHGISEDQLRLRFATFASVTVPLTPDATFSKSLGSHNKLVEVDGETAAVSIMGLTNATLRLAAPVPVDFGKAGVHLVSRIRFYVDDPSAALATARTVITSPDSGVSLPMDG